MLSWRNEDHQLVHIDSGSVGAYAACVDFMIHSSDSGQLRRDNDAGGGA
jgi:hypothetical protein